MNKTRYITDLLEKIILDIQLLSSIFPVYSLKSSGFLIFVLPDILAVLLSDVLLLLQEKDQRYVFATVVSDLSLSFYQYNTI